MHDVGFDFLNNSRNHSTDKSKSHFFTSITLICDSKAPRYFNCIVLWLQIQQVWCDWLNSSIPEARSPGVVWTWNMEPHHPVLPVLDRHSRRSAAARCRHPSLAVLTRRRLARPCVTAMLQPCQPLWIIRHLERSTWRNGRPADLCLMRTTFCLIQKFWPITQHKLFYLLCSYVISCWLFL